MIHNQQIFLTQILQKDNTPAQPKVDPVDTIINKLKKGNKQAGNMADEELREWASSLCKEQDLIEWYLNPEFASTIKIVRFKCSS